MQQYRAIATDYDGTLATHGRVDPSTIDALRRARDAGIHLVLITGRMLPHIKRDFPDYHLFETIIAEDGAIIYHPSTTQQNALGPAPDKSLLQEMNKQQIPFHSGAVLIATDKEYEDKIVRIIKETDTPYQINMNKDALMILPTGLDKGAGLLATLKELDIAPEQVIGFGDAENDVAFLSIVGCAVAVENALPSVKAIAHHVTRASRGAGVYEFIMQLLAQE